MNVTHDELQKIIEKSKSVLSAEEVKKLSGAVDTLAVMTTELELKGASIRRLRRLLFGPSSEKMDAVFPDKKSDSDAPKGGEADPKSDTDAKSDTDPQDDAAAGNNDDKSAPKKPSKKNPRKGHGRNGAKDYTGADKKKIGHETLKAKDNCPECLKGKLNFQK